MTLLLVFSMTLLAGSIDILGLAPRDPTEIRLAGLSPFPGPPVGSPRTNLRLSRC